MHTRLEAEAINFDTDPAWHEMFHTPATQEKVQEFKKWLRDNRHAHVELYHGTHKEAPILTEGILPTTRRRRNSPVSVSGYTYFFATLGYAQAFAAIGKGANAAVYKARVPVKKLQADPNQIKMLQENMGLNLNNDLATSLIFARAARIRGKIEPWLVQLATQPTHAP